MIIAQTSRQVKAAYKKNGRLVSEREMRQLERAAELDERAQHCREREERRKLAKKKKEEKERKEREARRQLGIGLATQLAGYSHSQVNMKSGMEAFLGIKRDKAKIPKAEQIKESKLEDQIEAIVEELDPDPSNVGEDETNLAALPDLCDEGKTDEWSDDDLDDASLLEITDMVMSSQQPKGASELRLMPPPTDRPLEPRAAPESKARQNDISTHANPNPPITTSSLPGSPAAPEAALKPAISRGRSVPPVNNTATATKVPQANPRMASFAKPSIPQESPEFSNLHGPINPAVEKCLAGLSAPVVELLSRDTSAVSAWKPLSSLVHRLTIFGGPPHRLRVKVGCVVLLLRDVNSRLQKDSRLRIVGIERDKLDCLVLDGQLHGTRTTLTRVPFSGRYQNQDRFQYTRLQFPVRVCVNHNLTAETTAKDPQRMAPPLAERAVQAPQDPKLAVHRPPTMKSPQRQREKPVGPQVKPILTPNPNTATTSKTPSVPASRVPEVSRSAAQPVVEPPSTALDWWDDFLATGTQIARELSPEDARKPSKPTECPSSQKMEQVPPESEERRSRPQIDRLPLKVLAGQSVNSPNQSSHESLDPSTKKIVNQTSSNPHFPSDPLSTQDIDFTLGDLEDLPQSTPAPAPVSKPIFAPVTAAASSLGQEPVNLRAKSIDLSAKTTAEATNKLTSASNEIARHMMPPPAASAERPRQNSTGTKRPPPDDSPNSFSRRKIEPPFHARNVAAQYGRVGPSILTTHVSCVAKPHHAPTPSRNPQPPRPSGPGRGVRTPLATLSNASVNQTLVPGNFAPRPVSEIPNPAHPGITPSCALSPLKPGACPARSMTVQPPSRATTPRVMAPPPRPPPLRPAVSRPRLPFSRPQQRPFQASRPSHVKPAVPVPLESNNSIKKSTPVLSRRSPSSDAAPNSNPRAPVPPQPTSVNRNMNVVTSGFATSSFRDFGLSTQDVLRCIDDDDCDEDGGF